MDHFALPDDSLAQAQQAGTLQRNFQGYSTHGECDLIGLGVSAISHVGRCYAQNAQQPPAYYKALSRGQLPLVRGLALNEDDILHAELIQSLTCRNRIDFDAVERQFEIHFKEQFARELDELRALAADGRVDVDSKGVAVTPRGRLLLRNVAMVFDASLRRTGAPPVTYSRAI